MAQARAETIIEVIGVDKASQVYANVKRAQDQVTDGANENAKASGKHEKITNSINKSYLSMRAIVKDVGSGLKAAVDFLQAGSRAVDFERQINMVAGLRETVDSLREGVSGTVDTTSLEQTVLLLRRIHINAEQAKTLGAFALTEAERSNTATKSVMEQIARTLASGRAAGFKRLGLQAKDVSSAIEEMGKIADEAGKTISGSLAISLDRVKTDWDNFVSDTQAFWARVAIGFFNGREAQLRAEGLSEERAAIVAELDNLSAARESLRGERAAIADQYTYVTDREAEANRQQIASLSESIDLRVRYLNTLVAEEEKLRASRDIMAEIDDISQQAVKHAEDIGDSIRRRGYSLAAEIATRGAIRDAEKAGADVAREMARTYEEMRKVSAEIEESSGVRLDKLSGEFDALSEIFDQYSRNKEIIDQQAEGLQGQIELLREEDRIARQLGLSFKKVQETIDAAMTGSPSAILFALASGVKDRPKGPRKREKEQLRRGVDATGPGTDIADFIAWQEAMRRAQSPSNIGGGNFVLGAGVGSGNEAMTASLDVISERMRSFADEFGAQSQSVQDSFSTMLSALTDSGAIDKAGAAYKALSALRVAALVAQAGVEIPAELAAAASAFGYGNIFGGIMHTASALKWGIVAGTSVAGLFGGSGSSAATSSATGGGFGTSAQQSTQQAGPTVIVLNGPAADYTDATMAALDTAAAQGRYINPAVFTPDVRRSIARAAGRGV